MTPTVKALNIQIVTEELAKGTIILTLLTLPLPPPTPPIKIITMYITLLVHLVLYTMTIA